MNIVGVDTALAHIGLVATTDDGAVLGVDYFEPPVWKLKKSSHISVAMLDVLSCRQVMRHILSFTARFSANVIAAELPFGGAKSSRAARCLGIMTGALAATHEADIAEVIFLTPQQVRKILIDNSSASKADIQAYLADDLAEHLMSFPQKAHEHIYDAYAVALAFVKMKGRKL